MFHQVKQNRTLVQVLVPVCSTGQSYFEFWNCNQTYFILFYTLIMATSHALLIGPGKTRLTGVLVYTGLMFFVTLLFVKQHSNKKQYTCFLSFLYC